jgi:hypothetical protein
VPVLQRRGLFRTEYQGKTLRENLGLRRPANRFTLRRAGETATGRGRRRASGGGSERGVAATVDFHYPLRVGH